MASAGYNHNEVRETFENFIKDVVEDREFAARTHPFALMRAVMVTTVTELMPCLRPMYEFDAIVARVGGEGALKMALVKAFHGALLRVLERSRGGTC
jgi:hypothetical protein